MSRRTNLVILCEDQQHATFARRFLKKMGWSVAPRVPPLPAGRGSGEQFVRQQFPKELAIHRSRRGAAGQTLIVLQDGDEKGVKARCAALDEACRDSDIRPRQPRERVAIVIPTRRIETWFAYLDGHTVDENKGYKRLERPRDCQRHVNALADMCRQDRLREPVPPSLRAACDEYNALKSV